MGKRKMSERLGEISYSTYGRKMEIINYINVKNVIIQFENGCIVKSSYSSFIKGIIINPYDKSICKVGYLGEGIYSRVNQKAKVYATWDAMIRRCYDDKIQKKFPTYIGCSVCDEWLNFQNFAKWFEEYHYEVEYEKMSLDKDILIKGNKVYSPQTCVFAPQKINVMFVKCDKTRGKYPIGVVSIKKGKFFIAKCSNTILNKVVHLGIFKTPEQAFISYKKYKENLIKTVANMYKPYIPLNLYNSLIRYRVDITD